MAVAPNGSLFVADYGNSTIRIVTSSGVVTTYAGHAGSPGHADGPRGTATFRRAKSVALDHTGNLYVADTDNHTIRKISPAGAVTTIAGSPGEAGFSDGEGAAARFSFQTDLKVDATGTIYVADSGNHAIRKVTPQGQVSTFVGRLY